MKREDIEKAAEECRRTTAQSMGVYGQYHSIDECPDHGLSCDELVEESFIKGAEWRINSVWHGAKEIPQLNKFFVFENEYCEWETDCLYMQQKWEVYVAKYDLIRWAYIKDLIPNTED